jgi:cell division protein FtsW (lipid II flippase)
VLHHHQERAIAQAHAGQRWQTMLRRPAAALAIAAILAVLVAGLRIVVDDLGIAIIITALAAITLAPFLAGRPTGGHA